MSDAAHAYIQLLEAEVTRQHDMIRNFKDTYDARVEPYVMPLFSRKKPKRQATLHCLSHEIPIDHPRLRWTPYRAGTDYGEVYVHNARLLHEWMGADYRDDAAVDLDIAYADPYYIECSSGVRGSFKVIHGNSSIYALTGENAKEVIRAIAKYRE